MITPNVRVGVACIISNHITQSPNSILLGQRLGSHGAGKWAVPGGHLEMNETFEECAVREVKEETNLSLENVKLLHVTNDRNIDDNPAKHYVTIFMKGTVKADSESLQLMEPHKCQEWCWIDWPTIIQMRESNPEKLFEPMIHFIDDMKMKGTLTSDDSIS